MKTLLVTGCSGFIGSNFCHLYGRKFRIIGVDALTHGSHPKNLSDSISFHQIDLRSEEALHQLFQLFKDQSGIDGIINFAAESHVDHSLADDSPFWSTNVLGPRNLAKIALRSKIRMLQVSTDEVYGSSNGSVPFTEEDRLNPRNPYAASKASAELLLNSYREAYGLDVVMTRGSNTLGPRQSPEKLVPKAILHFIKGSPFPLFRTPARRMWLSVQDHCRGVLAAFEKGKSGQVYNLSPKESEEFETSDVVERLRSLVGKGEIKLVDDRPGYDLRYLISSRKAREDLGWAPEENFNETLKNTARWYLNNTDWIESHPDFRHQYPGGVL